MVPSSTELQRRGTLASFVKKLTNRPFPFHDFCRHTHRALHFSAAITAKKSPTTVNYREKVLPRLVRTKYNLFARKARAGRPGVAKTNETSMFQWRTILSARKTSASATQRRTNPLTVTRRRRHPVSVRSGWRARRAKDRGQVMLCAIQPSSLAKSTARDKTHFNNIGTNHISVMRLPSKRIRPWSKIGANDGNGRFEVPLLASPVCGERLKGVFAG